MDSGAAQKTGGTWRTGVPSAVITEDTPNLVNSLTVLSVRSTIGNSSGFQEN